jgi:peptide/nickel transport system substrate-binding protein
VADQRHGPDFDLTSMALSRRSALKGGAAVFGGLSVSSFLAACNDDDDDDGGGGGSASTDNVQPRRGGQIKMAFGDALSSDNPDPTTAFTFLGVVYSGMVFDCLVSLNNGWEVGPMLATEWSNSPDFKTWTFKLRDGVEFHNGQPMTAEDVAFSFQRIFDENVGSAGLGLWQTVLDPKGVKAVDKRTIRFDLKAADAYFLIKVGHWYGKVVPDGTKDFDAGKGSFGTGPFKVVSFKGGTGFELERNENYWMDNRPYLDGVQGVVVLEPATRTQAVLTGDTDICDPPTFPTLAEFEGSSTARLLDNSFGSATVWGIDTSTAPFNNKDFRTAAKMAIDREAFVKIVARDFATVSPDGFVNPNETYFPQGFEPVPYDPEQAKSLLQSSGQPTSGYTIWSTDSLRALGEGSTLLRQQWGEIGLEAEVRDVSFDDLFSKRFLVEKIVANYWGRQHFSTMLPLMYPIGSPYSESRAGTKQIDDWLNELMRTPLDEGGQELLDEILPAYQEATAPIWPFAMKDVWGCKNRVHDVELTPTEMVEVRNAFVT